MREEAYTSNRGRGWDTPRGSIGEDHLGSPPRERDPILGGRGVEREAHLPPEVKGAVLVLVVPTFVQR